MTLVDLPVPGAQVGFDLSRRALHLYPAIGGAQFGLGLDIYRVTERKDAPPLTLAALLYVNDAPSQGRQMLTRLEAPNAINPAQPSTRHELVGMVTDEQLRLVEHRRKDMVWIDLELTIGGIDGDPPVAFTTRGLLHGSLESSEWVRELERVDAGAYAEVLVPITADSARATAANRIREARQLIHAGRYDDAVTATRKALDPLRASASYKAILKSAQAKNARGRDQNERFVLSVEADYSMASGAAHDDPGVTDNFTWTKDQATGMTARIAAHLLWPPL